MMSEMIIDISPATPQPEEDADEEATSINSWISNQFEANGVAVGNGEELLTKIRNMSKKQNALKLEVEELKTKLEENAEYSKGLEKRVEEVVDMFNTTQLRMPARLHNATCHRSPQAIKAPPISEGKIPKNFPNTRGEFEHLTRERYEGILNEYGVKHSGDVNEKRETLRAFLGIPEEMLKK